jgi:ATP-dependent DNA helicase RecG
MTPQEWGPENRLQFDKRAAPGASVEDLSVALREQHLVEKCGDTAPETFPDFDAWLGQREILRRSPSGWSPTVAGMLVFGISPHRFIPGAIVEFVRYAGIDFESPIARRKTITGSLPVQLDTLWAQLESQIAEVPAGDEGIRSPFGPLYSLEGLKDLARNLVQHRLYEGTDAPARVAWLDDRVVFINPGSRFGQAREGVFGEHSDYRNPTITRFLVELGYVERLGRGIRLVRRQLEKMGSPALEVETDGFTTVTIRPSLSSQGNPSSTSRRQTASAEGRSRL